MNYFKPGFNSCLLLLLCFANAAFGEQSAPTGGSAEGTSSNVDDQRAERSNGDRKTARQKIDSSVQRLSKDEERSAIAFADLHHPALASLVKKLRTRDSDAYQKALQELQDDSVKLRRMEERQPKRFETEIGLWKVESEIRLQLARWAVSESGSERFEKNIRRLLAKRHELRRRRLIDERERLLARIEQVNEQLNMKSDAQKAAVDQEWGRLTKRFRTTQSQQAARKARNRVGPKANSAESKNGSKINSGASASSKQPLS